MIGIGRLLVNGRGRIGTAQFGRQRTGNDYVWLRRLTLIDQRFAVFRYGNHFVSQIAEHLLKRFAHPAVVIGNCHS